MKKADLFCFFFFKLKNVVSSHIIYMGTILNEFVYNKNGKSKFK